MPAAHPLSPPPTQAPASRLFGDAIPSPFPSPALSLSLSGPEIVTPSRRCLHGFSVLACPVRSPPSVKLLLSAGCQLHPNAVTAVEVQQRSFRSPATLRPLLSFFISCGWLRFLLGYTFGGSSLKTLVSVPLRLVSWIVVLKDSIFLMIEHFKVWVENFKHTSDLH